MAQTTQTPEDLFDDALTTLTVKHAFLATYFMSYMKAQYKQSCKTAATDGKTVFYGDYFANLPLQKRKFALGHEIWHSILEHMKLAGRYAARGFGPDFKPFSRGRANSAMDCQINAMLKIMKCGEFDPTWLFRDLADAELTWDEIYKDMDEPPEGEEGQDEHMEPPEGTDLSEDDSAQKRALAGALQADAQQKSGNLPASIRRLIEEFLDPVQPWQRILQEYVMACAGKEESSWARINRRRLILPPGILYPGRDGCTINCLVTTVDVSGSIDEDTLKQFLAEVRGIAEQVRPREMWVIVWDTVAKAHQIEEPEDMDAVVEKVYGGGGTNYDCALTLIDNMGLEPDVCITFTDGYVSCSKSAVPYPHVTLTTGMELPFGKNIKA